MMLRTALFAAVLPVIDAFGTSAHVGQRTSHVSMQAVVEAPAAAVQQTEGRVMPTASVAKPAPAAKPAEAEEPKDAALRAVIASKQKVFDAHAADVDASLAYFGTLLRNKEVREYEQRPGADLTVLDGSMAGDCQFDPLRLADTKTHLLVYREAEIKHGRLAMLAAAGWPLSELLHGPLTAATDSSSLLRETAGRAPSVLNGGLGEVNGAFWLAAFALAAAVENNSLQYQLNGWRSADKPWTYKPGDLNFDPLDMQNKLAEQVMQIDLVKQRAPDLKYEDPYQLKATVKFNIEMAEVVHGRVAMLAIVGFALQELLWGTPVVEQTPIFFATPLYQGLTAAANWANAY